MIRQYYNRIMGNFNSFCDNGPVDREIVHEVRGKKWIMRYGSDPEKTVQHQQLDIPNLELRQQLKPLIDELKSQNLQYLDPDFSTKPIILKSQLQNKKCRWQRPQEVIGQQYTIYSGQKQDIFTKDEVMQYFGAFLIFVRRNPQLIFQIILTQKNTFGFHALKVFIENEQQFFLIDDKFISDQNKKQYLFSQPLGNSIWTLILEKAWMKYLGNIKDIEHHQPYQPYCLFINKPFSVLSLIDIDPDKLKTIISNNKNIIFESKKQNVMKIGLSGKKYFTLICSFYINDQFFVVLRNPCGKFGFRGIWAQPTVGQTRKMQQLGCSIHTPGNFIVDQSQLTQFSNLTIFHYSKNFQTTQILLNSFVNTPIYVKIRIRQEQNIFFSINQQQPLICPLMIDLFQIPSYDVIPTNSVWPTKVLNLSQTMLHLKNGHYILRIKPKHLQTFSKPRTLNLQCYSLSPIDIQQGSQNQQIYNSFLLHSAKTSISRQVTKLDFSYKLTWFPNRVLVYIKNNHKNGRQIKLDLYFPAIKNLQTFDEGLKQLNRREYCSVTLRQQFLLVFQKIQLHKETYIGQFSITSY